MIFFLGEKLVVKNESVILLSQNTKYEILSGANSWT